jgi:hypothetical protein
VNGKVLDFIIIGIRKRKGKRNIHVIFQNLNFWGYLENVFLSRVSGIIFGLFMDRGLCWCQLFLPTVSHGTTVRQDPDNWNTMIFWSRRAVVTWVRSYRLDGVSIQIWFGFLFQSLVRKNLKVKHVQLVAILGW